MTKSSDERNAAGQHATTDLSGVSRRRLLQIAGTGAGAGLLGALPNFAGAARASAATAPAVPENLTGTIADLEHVVILMQENRSFDHYYGMLPGVRGFGDKQALHYPDGTSVFQQPDPNRSDGGHLLPYRLDTSRFNAQNAGGLAHSWPDAHSAWAGGRLDGWVSAKGEQTMGYFTGDDIPWQHTLASAYTICDHYHCALAGGTSPNRLYMWSGTIDPDGTHHGPATGNSGDYGYTYTWSTYPEALQRAGVSWQIYVNNNEDHDWFGDYTDNTVRSFAQFDPDAPGADTSPGGLLGRGNVLQTHVPSPPDVPNSPDNLDYVLQDFISDCASGELPEVSWVVAPYKWCEHPSAAPDWGAIYSDRVISALHANPDLWNSTLLIMVFDENDGYFDHVPAPLPEPGTPGEFVDDVAIGPGARVPMILVSPWTRGGWVSSEVFDHTSLIQFLERWTRSLGKPAVSTNISPWRRTVCGDLLSAIDFRSFDNSLPTLPDTAVLAAAATADESKPSVAGAIPEPGAQQMPVPPPGSLRPRPVPHNPAADLAVDRRLGIVRAHLTNSGRKGVSLQVYPDAHRAFEATPFTVTRGTPRTFEWDTGTTDGAYAFSIYGPDRFVRSFAGTVVPSGDRISPCPRVTARPAGRRALQLHLANDGGSNVELTITRNDFAGGRDLSVILRPRASRTVHWPVDRHGYYDVIVEAAGGFRQRYAGRLS